MEGILWVIGLVLLTLFGLVVFFGPPFVPTRKRHLDKGLDELLKPTKKDFVVDLGSGSGTVLHACGRRGVPAVGFELNPLLVILSNIATRQYRHVRAMVANFWTKPFPDETTVVYIFGDSRDIRKIERRVQAEATRLERPIRVLSYGFQLPTAKLIGHTDTYYLYSVAPLHAKKPQV